MVYIETSSRHLRSNLGWLTEAEECRFFSSYEGLEAAVDEADQDYTLIFDENCNLGLVSAFVSRHEKDRHFTRAIVLSNAEHPGTRTFTNGHTLHVTRGRLQQELMKNKGEKRELATENPTASLIGSSAAMQRVRQDIINAGSHHCNVTIVGESGTGKELAAHAVHKCSSRTNPVVFNCGVLNSNLQMDTLFGHAHSSFTGADNKEDHMGAIEEADGSSFILDEIEALSLDTQSMLLRAVENGEVRRLGDNKLRHVDCRYIAVTNREPKELVNEGKLRFDLTMRLCGAFIRIPPLREHIEDLEELVRYKEEQMETEDHIVDMESLKSYSWPGNVRELFNSVERIHREGKALSPKLSLSDFGFENF